MVIELILTYSVLFTALYINILAAKFDLKFALHKNTVNLSIGLFTIWLLVTQIFPISKLKWNLSLTEFTTVFGIMVILVILNLFLYDWYTKGNDYNKFQEQGIVQDGCPYNGKYSILKNMFTHGGEVLWEEILFRGIISLILYSLFGIVAAILIPSFLFGLMHFIPYRNFAIKHGIKPGRLVYGAFIGPFVFPSIFAYCNFYWESLIPGWIMHWGLNCSVGLYLRYIYPAIYKTNLIKA